MTPQQARVVQAEADARAARQRLEGTLAAVQARLRPAVLVREARRELVEARGTATNYTIRHPGPVAVGGTATLLFLLRRPLWRLMTARPRATTAPKDR